MKLFNNDENVLAGTSDIDLNTLRGWNEI